MKKKDDINIINEPDSIFNGLDNIPRCLECNLISSLKLYYKEGKPLINFIFVKIIIKEIFLWMNIWKNIIIIHF